MNEILVRKHLVDDLNYAEKCLEITENENKQISKIINGLMNGLFKEEIANP